MDYDNLPNRVYAAEGNQPYLFPEMEEWRQRHLRRRAMRPVYAVLTALAVVLVAIAYYAS